MRDFAKISCSIWRSRKFTGLPNDEARYLYLYLHTCPHVNSLGCFVLPEGYALADLKWTDPKAFRKGIETLCEAGLIGFQEDESVVRIVDFLKHSPFTNPNHAAGALAVLDKIPDGPEKDCVIRDLSVMKHVQTDKLPPVSGNPLESLSKPSRNTETKTKTKTERETERKVVVVADAPGADPEGSNLRERVLSAMGVGPDGVIGPSKFIGSPADVAEARRWLALPGMTVDTIEAEISEVMRGKRGGPPARFSYFTPAMQRLSDALTAPPLAPIEGSSHEQARPAFSDRRAAAADDALRQRIEGAARNRSPSKGGIRFG